MSRAAARRPSAGLAALAAGLALGLVLFLGLGHGLHASMSADHEQVAAGLTGVCLVLFTLLVPLGVAPRRPERPVAPPRPASPVYVRPALRPPPGARASPAWLQRFLH